MAAEEMLSMAAQLRRAVATASNDDYTEAGSEKRHRHTERCVAMLAAADLFEKLAKADDQT